jgi:hypothetical protein
MNRNKLKALGLALAALASTTAAASAAEFTSSNHHFFISGSQKAGTDDVFVHDSGFAITCKSAIHLGTATGTSLSSMTFGPSLSGCEDSIGRVVDASGGSYVLTPNGTLHTEGTFEFKITSSGSTVCTITISAQSGVNGISYTNLGGTNGIEITQNSTNVKSRLEPPAFFTCGTTVTDATNSTIQSTFIIKGEDTSGNPIAISKD